MNERTYMVAILDYNNRFKGFITSDSISSLKNKINRKRLNSVGEIFYTR